MADIKTILRETSVVFGLNGISPVNFSIKDYTNGLKIYLDNYEVVKSELQKLDDLKDFSGYHDILENGYNLGKEIKALYNTKGPINWLGRDVKSKYPIDLSVGDLKISLKEHSFILKNPALASYLNSLTQINPPFKVVHVFRHFAPKLFSEWFTYSLNKIFSLPEGFEYQNKEKNCSFRREGNNIVFKSSSKSVKISQQDKTTELEFNKKLGGDLLKYTLSKWINENMDNDVEYVRLKKLCSLEAGKVMTSFVKENQNIKKEDILGLFQIYSDKYLYAKVSRPPIILEVPSISEIDVDVVKVDVSVPKSQLNILFTMRFSTRNQHVDISFRVECRYSHGQFNGTPEAKLYYNANEDISKIYRVK
jgi:hypothetical protein